MNPILTALLSASVMGAIVTAILNVLFRQRLEKISTDIKNQSDKLSLIYKSRYSWQEASIAGLLGPVNMLLYRTEIAFRRLQAHNTFVEAKILKESNEKIRDLLLQQSHLIPAVLQEDANQLLTHYDRYLEEFERLRGADAVPSDEPFVFVGPKGFPFPRASADKFQAYYRELWQQLYGA